MGTGGVAAIFLGDLASREAYPGIGMDILLVHDGGPGDGALSLCRRFRRSLTDLSRDSLLFSPVLPGPESLPALSLTELPGQCRSHAAFGISLLTRARCVFEAGVPAIGRCFDEARQGMLADPSTNEVLVARLRELPEDPGDRDIFNYARMRGGLNDVERAARFLQLTGAGPDDPAPTATAVLEAGGAGLWRRRLPCGGMCRESPASSARRGSGTTASGSRARSVVAQACGYEDFDAVSRRLRYRVPGRHRDRHPALAQVYRPSEPELKNPGCQRRQGQVPDRNTEQNDGCRPGSRTAPGARAAPAVPRHRRAADAAGFRDVQYLLHGGLYRDMLPLMDGRRPLDEIAAALEGAHAATDVLAAVAGLSARGMWSPATTGWTGIRRPGGHRSAHRRAGSSTGWRHSVSLLKAATAD